MKEAGVVMKFKARRWQIGIIIFSAAFMGLMYLIATEFNGGTKTGTDFQITPLPTKAIDEKPRACIVIDPGHGGFDGGASGTKTGTPESVINLEISKYLKAELEKSNIKVILTRDTETALADTKKADMKLRRSMMHDSGADMTLSIHLNKFRDSSISGPMVFYTKGDEPSAQFAGCVLKAICEELGRPQRLTNPGDYYVIRDSKIPAIIIECGFLSNAEDEKKLCDSAYQKRIAAAIAKGIDEYLNNYFETEPPLGSERAEKDI